MPSNTDITPVINQALETDRKFEFYFSGLIFTLLGLSVQTSRPDADIVPVTLELLGSSLFLVSGIIAIIRLTWLRDRLWRFVDLETTNREMQDFERYKRDGGTYLIQQEDNTKVAIAECIATKIEEDAILNDIISSLARKGTNYFKAQLWTFFAAILFIMISRVWPQIIGIYCTL